MSIDKIGYGVYNVHRNPPGSIYIYIGGKYTYPLGVFQGILSEYLALKCSPIVVYMDFRDFLVMLYIYGVHPHHTLANPRAFQGQLVNQKNICTSHKLCPWGFLGFPLWLPIYLWGCNGNFCNLV